MEKKKNIISRGSDKILKIIERLGNKLPHPFFMFMYIAIGLAVLSAGLGGLLNITFDGFDNSGELVEISIVNLLNSEGIKWFFENMITNFLGVGSIGTIVMTVTTVYVSERVGLMKYMIKRLTKVVRKEFVTPVIIFIGILSSMASDAGYIVLVPLGAVIFYSYGKHPLAGIAAAFAGVSGGFSANLLVGPIDALVAGVAQDMTPEGAEFITTTSHWFFLIASTFLLTIVGWFVTSKIVEPKLGEFKGKGFSSEADNHVSMVDKKAARNALLAFLVFIAFIATLSIDVLWELLGASGTEFMIDDKSYIRYAPLGIASQYGGITYGAMIAIVPIIYFSLLIPAIAFGMTNKTIKSKNDIYTYLVEGFKSTVPILVIIFWIGQFIEIFKYTNLDRYVAVILADGLQAINITNSLLLLIMFILVVAVINIAISGLSTKLYLVGPIFVPALYHLGIEPTWTLLGYRVADSSTNIIAPLMSYMPIIVVFCHNWLTDDEKDEFGVGSLMSMMFPYSVLFLTSSVLLLVIFYVFGIPLGF